MSPWLQVERGFDNDVRMEIWNGCIRRARSGTGAAATAVKLSAEKSEGKATDAGANCWGFSSDAPMAQKLVGWYTTRKLRLARPDQTPDLEVRVLVECIKDVCWHRRQTTRLGVSSDHARPPKTSQFPCFTFAKKRRSRKLSRLAVTYAFGGWYPRKSLST